LTTLRINALTAYNHHYDECGFSWILHRGMRRLALSILPRSSPAALTFTTFGIGLDKDLRRRAETFVDELAWTQRP
jgi:hypothetical protein